MSRQRRRTADRRGQRGTRLAGGRRRRGRGPVGAVAALVGAAADSVRRAAGRLDAHADQVREIRRQVAALQDEQDDQFREAWNRWARVENLQLQIMVGGPEVRAIIDEVDAGEASRRRRHHALLEELADDAAATARILAEASAVVGGRGVRGDANRVVAYLAAELPGWGDLELARRGREWADQLGQWLDPSHRDALAQEVLPLAGSAAFAGAFLQALGVVWMRDLLQSLGEGDDGPNSALARTVALSLGVASRDGVRSAPVAEVLGAKYVSADDLNGLDDLAVLGMGTVLAASRALGAGGLAPATVAAWGRQIALRERTVGAAAIDRINPLGQQAAPVDALPLVVAILADGEDPASAAEFLSGPSVWNVLLTRSWDDCGLSLGHLTATAGTVEGPAGEAVVRSGLEALGARLADEDSGDWPVHRATANAVTPALADALAAHVSLAGGVLTASVDGELAAADGAMLRGLGFVTLDRHAAAVVEDALASWVAVQPVPAWTAGPPPPLPTVVVRTPTSRSRTTASGWASLSTRSPGSRRPTIEPSCGTAPLPSLLTSPPAHGASRRESSRDMSPSGSIWTAPGRAAATMASRSVRTLRAAPTSHR